jgi:three-Cys-motif partner protein
MGYRCPAGCSKGGHRPDAPICFVTTRSRGVRPLVLDSFWCYLLVETWELCHSQSGFGAMRGYRPLNDSPSIPGATPQRQPGDASYWGTMSASFFEERSEASEVKAQIVDKYFKAWAAIVAPRARDDKIAYIDLFAGPGRYKDGSASVPLMILESAIKDPVLCAKLVTVFNDKNGDNTRTLEEEIGNLEGIEKLKFKPQVMNNEVGVEIAASFEKTGLIPTLFFVDPWGYKGLSLRLINSVLKNWGCDCIVFFNYNRINMGLTNPIVTEHMNALFGEERANALRDELKDLSASKRELKIVEEMSAALQDMGGKFVLPFCFKNESGARTSHYLFFVSKNVTAYTIMKGIMGGESTKHEQNVPSFSHCAADASMPVLFELGRWFLRKYQSGKYSVVELGQADDARDADGDGVLDFEQAYARARARLERPLTLGRMTVRQAFERYVDFKKGAGQPVGDLMSRGRAHILPTLGDLVVADLTADRLRKWHTTLAAGPAQVRPKAGIRRNLIDPDTAKPFQLLPAEIVFLRHAFELDSRGRLKHPELVYAAIKKSGKTGFAAMIVLYVILILAGPGGEGYCVANDLEQSTGRVFAAIVRIVEASPLLAQAARITATKITFPEQRASITAIANDYAGAAGANPNISVFDELWAYTSERSRRLWDEMVPPPTRKIACRLTVTYAGYTGESELLEELGKRGLGGEPVGPDLYASPGLLCFWSHTPIAPWQTDAWLDEMRQSLRRPAYLRMIENRFVTSESTFIDLTWFDACVDPTASPVLESRHLPVYVGVDASVKRDSTAIVVTTYDRDLRKVRLITHKIFQPSPSDPLDFEATVEDTILNLRRRFRVRQVLYDPYQMAAVAQRLARAHVPMVEYPQSVPNLTEIATNLYELFKGKNLIVYASFPFAANQPIKGNNRWLQ